MKIEQLIIPISKIDMKHIEDVWFAELPNGQEKSTRYQEYERALKEKEENHG